MKLDTILFDLDNTLVKTDMKYINKVLKKVIESFEKEFSEDLAEKFWFCSGRSYFGSMELGINDNEFWKKYRDINSSKKNCNFTNPFYDIDFIDYIDNEGFKTGIVTSAPEYMAKPIIEKIGKNRFDIVVYQNAMHGFKHKPHPQGIKFALEKLNSKPENSAYVGDTSGDIKAAERAGVFPIFIDRKTHSIDQKVESPLKITSLYCIGKFLQLEGY